MPTKKDPAVERIVDRIVGGWRLERVYDEMKGNKECGNVVFTAWNAMKDELTSQLSELLSQRTAQATSRALPPRIRDKSKKLKKP